MKKYTISVVSKRFDNNTTSGGAVSKAPADISLLAKKAGYEELVVFMNYRYGKLLGYLNVLRQLFVSSFRLKKGDVVMVQYPQICNPIFMPIVHLILHKCKRVVVIHDMFSLRETDVLSKREIKALSAFSNIYVHTDNMKQYLEDKIDGGVHYHVLGCFPYIAQSVELRRHQSNQVCFAGNLDKSSFLTDFARANDKLEILLFGSIKDKSVFDGKAHYMGRFSPNDISMLQGSWGLVWDGDSMETCTGHYGEYLKLIAPHKFSLYLVAKMPVIVWRESAMAKLVMENNLGVVIDSLSQIYGKISEIDEVQYQLMLDSINSFVISRMNNCSKFK